MAKTAHTYNSNSVCTYCGAVDTSYLTYTLESDGTYSVSAGTSKTYTSITIPNTYNGKAVTKIAAGGFYGYTALQTLTLGSNIKAIKGSSTKGAFEGCSNLSSVTLNSGLQEIGAYAFGDCSKLTRITIPSTVTDIGTSAFYGCGLTSVYIPASVTSMGSNVFSNCPDNLVISCAAASRPEDWSYGTSSNWNGGKGGSSFSKYEVIWNA